ncbi:hypothetical protein ACIRU3_30765 [Streptomyces sp. NPDC101151]|uniref:hypothetical protein n=1 Tax=Streptomyces sp. NPDC101151 TaxID=3366115 RepID=UPI00382EC291
MSRWRHVLVPVAGAAITVAVIAQASGAAQAVGAAWLVIGLLVLVGQRGRTSPSGARGRRLLSVPATTLAAWL